MSKKNGSTRLPRPKREAISEDLRVLEEILRDGKSVDENKPADRLLADLLAPDSSLRPRRSRMPWNAVRNSWFGAGLRRCVKENRPDTAKALLRIMLSMICGGVVDNDALRAFETAVFRDFPQLGGRPVSEERDPIYQCWLENGKPSPTSYALAWKYYGAEFEKADASERRRLCNQCRAAVRRAQQAENARTNRNSDDIFPGDYPTGDIFPAD